MISNDLRRVIVRMDVSARKGKAVGETEYCGRGKRGKPRACGNPDHLSLFFFLYLIELFYFLLSFNQIICFICMDVANNTSLRTASSSSTSRDPISQIVSPKFFLFPTHLQPRPTVVSASSAMDKQPSSFQQLEKVGAYSSSLSVSFGSD